jgi:hypothetical protein
MNPPIGRGQDAQNQGGQRDGQGGPQDGNRDGNGNGGNGNGQGDGGGQPPLAYQNAADFFAALDAAPSDHNKNNLEQEAVSRSPAQDVQFAAMLKINLRMQALVVQLNTRVNQAQGQVDAANAIARQAQAAAHGAANMDHWILVTDDYL